MENQHAMVRGYRDLTQGEIDIMNQVKDQAEQVRELIERVKRAGEEIDLRWVAIAQTQLQQGFMALTRAIARPTTF